MVVTVNKEIGVSCVYVCICKVCPVIMGSAAPCKFLWYDSFAIHIINFTNLTLLFERREKENLIVMYIHNQTASMIEVKGKMNKTKFVLVLFRSPSFFDDPGHFCITHVRHCQQWYFHPENSKHNRFFWWTKMDFYKYLVNKYILYIQWWWWTVDQQNSTKWGVWIRSKKASRKQNQQYHLNVCSLCWIENLFCYVWLSRIKSCHSVFFLTWKEVYDWRNWSDIQRATQ